MDPQNVLCKAEAGWIPPDIHWYKLNVDAETDISNGITGLGAIKRNSNGDFMAASARKKSFLGDVEIADAEAILQCIKLATDSGFSPLIVESDSANVVLLSHQARRIISEITSFMDKQNFQAKHVCRNCNTVAH